MRLDGKSFLAEMIGTFTLVFFGAGAIMTQNANQMVGMTGIAVAHGLAILVMIYAFGHILYDLLLVLPDAHDSLSMTFFIASRKTETSSSVL